MKEVLWMEILKIRRTKIFPATIIFFIFVGIMMGMLMFMAMHPEIASRSATIQMKSSFVGTANWQSFYTLMIEVVLTIVVIGSGIITSWEFGREFSDRTMKDLLALPVLRSTIVYSKLIVLVIWSILLSVIVLAAAMLTGFAIHLPGWNIDHFRSFFSNYMLAATLNILLISPVALIASIGRGYLLPISFVILIMILSQLVMVSIPTLSYWIPWLLPALLSGVIGAILPPPGFLSCFLYVFVVLGALIGTVAWWNLADQK